MQPCQALGNILVSIISFVNFNLTILLQLCVVNLLIFLLDSPISLQECYKNHINF